MSYRATGNFGPYVRDYEYDEEEVVAFGRDLNADLAAEILVSAAPIARRRVVEPNDIEHAESSSDSLEESAEASE